MILYLRLKAERIEFELLKQGNYEKNRFGSRVEADILGL